MREGEREGGRRDGGGGADIESLELREGGSQLVDLFFLRNRESDGEGPRREGEGKPCEPSQC
jgi:hypothetical protein